MQAVLAEEDTAGPLACAATGDAGHIPANVRWMTCTNTEQELHEMEGEIWSKTLM
jgi:hypothetical protein